MSERPILIIDAMNSFIRYYCANPTLNDEGEPIGGIIGFLKALTAFIKRHYPEKVFVVWEAGGSQRRRQLYPDYKSGRKPLKLNRTYEVDTENEAELNKASQINVLTKMLRCLPICQIYVENCEADDVIGYLCKKKFPEEEKIIISSDKDFYQLLDENTKIYRPGKKTYVTEETVKEEFNISPNNFLLARACDGDSSDNITGIERVGLKTMAKRFDLNGPQMTVDDLMDICEAERQKKKAPKIYENIVNGRDIIERNCKLMDLDVAMLSYGQITKVNDTVDDFVPHCNKIRFLKRYIKYCANGLDCENICTSLYYLAQK